MHTYRFYRDEHIAFANANGLRLCYESFGKPDDPAVLMIMGLGAQMTVWPLPLCQAIAEQGFRVIRFDNRDIGLSSKLANLNPTPWHKVVTAGLFGLPIEAPYSLNEMVKDAIGLLDALNIQKAHFVGASMGGMIAQLAAIHFPERLLSLNAIMTSSGARGLPRGNLATLWKMCRPRPKNESADAALRRLVQICQSIGGREFMDGEHYLQERLRSDIRRGYHPAGVARQTAAVATAPPRKERLARVTTPALVIHGTKDPVLPHAHAIDLAGSIPNARLKLIEGMGHYLSLSLASPLAEQLVEHMKSAASPRLIQPIPRPDRAPAPIGAPGYPVARG